MDDSPKDPKDRRATEVQRTFTKYCSRLSERIIRRKCDMNTYRPIMFIVLPFLLLVTPMQAQESDVCEPLKGSGKAYGICTAATHGVGCGESDQSVSPAACARLEAQYQEATGGEQPPWLSPVCPEAP